MTDAINPAELIKQSVTKGDYLSAKETAGGTYAVIGPTDFMWGGLLAGVTGAHGLPPPYTRARDVVLSNSRYIEGMWAAALGIATSKVIAQGYTIADDTDSDRRLKQARRVIAGFDGWWFDGIAKNAQDYLTLNNGAHIQIVYERGGSSRRVAGIVHLDGLHCYPTGDPAEPVLYWPRRGEGRKLRHEEVIRLVDMPSPRAGAWNIGQCAADRAWEAIIRLCAVQTYFREKLTGSRNLAIHFITGINPKTLDEALHTPEDNPNDPRRPGMKPFVIYRGSPIIPLLVDSGTTPSLITIPLAEIPDGFDVATERNNAHLNYANALGIALQDLQPLSGQGLGTGTQSIILAEEAEGRGMAAYKRNLSAHLTERVLASSTSFAFATNDTRDKKEKAEAAKVQADMLGVLVDKGSLTPDQMLNVMVDEGFIDRAYLPSDETPGAVLTDQDAVVEQSELVAATGETIPLRPEMIKAKRKADVLIDAETIAKARGWLDE